MLPAPHENVRIQLSLLESGRIQLCYFGSAEALLAAGSIDQLFHSSGAVERDRRGRPLKRELSSDGTLCVLRSLGSIKSAADLPGMTAPAVKQLEVLRPYRPRLTLVSNEQPSDD